MIPVSRPHFGVEEEAAVVAALRSGWVTQGPRVAEFERAFAAALGPEDHRMIDAGPVGDLLGALSHPPG